MARYPRAHVKTELLVWARESAGYSIPEAAKKAHVSVEKLEAWESGAAHPTINQLRELGRIYSRPIGVFFLPEPPEGFQALHDYRRLPGEVAGTASPELRWEIRLAHARREAALELLTAEDDEPSDFEPRATLREDPLDVAGRLRTALEVTREEQLAWSTPYEALNGWRSAIEKAGVLVFQATGVPLAECRGFSIADYPMPAIVANTKDAPNGRIFTLLHEFTHLMLRRGGLCDLMEQAFRPPEEQATEVFCNAVAGAALAPPHWLEEEPEVQLLAAGERLELSAANRLARRYSVSREVILRRLLDMELISAGFYEVMRERLLEEYRERERRGGGKGFAPPDTMAVASAGPLFTELVLRSYHARSITASDVSNYLGVRLKHLPSIEERVLGWSPSGEATV